MKYKESIQNFTIRKQAIDFLSRKNDFKKLKSFHRTLRYEILYGLIPRSCEEDSNDELRKNQRAALNEVFQLLTKTGFLRDQQGLNQLGTIIKFSTIVNQQLRFEFKTDEIMSFCNKGLQTLQKSFF